MTRKSGDASTIWAIMRRMKALSSTTRTVETGLDDTVSLLERPHCDPSVNQVKIHASPVIETGVLRQQRDSRRGQHVARRDDVPLADVDPGTGDELAEHARATDDLRADVRR